MFLDLKKSTTTKSTMRQTFFLDKKKTTTQKSTMRQTWQELPAAATSPQPQQESENLTI